MLIIEDGTGVTDANAYISVAELQAYATARNLTISTDNDVLEASIVVASADFMSVNYIYAGTALTETQGMQLPTDIVGINKDIKKGSCEAALLQLKGKLFVDPSELNINGKLKSVDDKLSVLGSAEEYFEGTAYTSKYPTRHIDRIVSKYLLGGSGYAPDKALRY